MMNIYRTRHGRLAHFKNDATIGASLARYGEWAEEEIFLMSRYLKPGNTVLDIGAHVGTHSLAFARLVGPQGRVISMDAQHRIFQLLCMNMIMNGLDQVDCMNVLVGSSVGVGMIPVTDIDTNETISFGEVTYALQARGPNDKRPTPRLAPVATITVDSLALGQCAAMKVDVEDMEVDVFRGAKATIVRCKPLIYFEQRDELNFAAIWRFFDDIGYDLFWHVTNPFNAKNFNGYVHNIFGGSCEVNVVAVPRGNGDLISRLGLANARIEASVYNPLRPANSIAGWSLPDGAYGAIGPSEFNVPGRQLAFPSTAELAALQNEVSQVHQQIEAPQHTTETTSSVTVEGVKYDELAIRILKASLDECVGHRGQNVADFCKLFNVLYDFKIECDAALQYRLVRLAGTSLLEAAFILRSLSKIKTIPGDWCEYGVAHGRTSALLAQVMMQQQTDRKLWLYDSFEGLPRPHEKDILLHDIFNKKTMEAYEGTISIPERYLRSELESVTSDSKHFKIIKGWITSESLQSHSPEQICFAYLDMDLYKSTYIVLKFLIDRMPSGGIVVVDDYGFFSDGVKTAVTEILAEYPDAFAFEHPYGDKFVILTRQ